MQEVEEEDSAMQSSSQSDTVTNSEDDEDYVPESLPKPKSWSCGANEEGDGEQSSENQKGRQCEQRKVRSLSQQNIMLGSHALFAVIDILQMVKRLALHHV